MLSFLNGLSYRYQIGLKLMFIKFSLIWDQSDIYNLRALYRKTFKIKIMLKELLLKMLILLQSYVVAKIFDPNPWNFYTKNWSLSALWILFQNYFCIFRSRMASFSYIYFGMKHHVIAVAWTVTRLFRANVWGPLSRFPLEKAEGDLSHLITKWSIGRW